MRALLRKETGLFVLLAVLCAITASINHRFLLPENLQNISRLVGIFGILSIGSGIVIITSGIDLSVGSMLALLGVLLAMMLNEKHWSPPLAILIVLALGSLLGLFHSELITRVKMQPFIVTLCGLLFYRGIARFVTGDDTKGFGEAKGFEWLRDFATGSPLGLPTPCWVLIVVAIVMWVVLHRSVYGRHLFAAGNNESAARFSGIDTTRVIGSAYVLSGFLTAISAILLAFYTNSISPSGHGNSYELYGIAAAVLGGCSLRGGEGSIVGIILGTILIQVLRNLVNLLNISSSLEFAVMGAVILLGVLADQFLSRRKRTKS
ncbi:MAG TPA: ABC transporter permease [Fimbriimonas sp.]|nr:ABC transporter permease [Fimbriimonas sp.]